jgi:hypothetical protein
MMLMYQLDRGVLQERLAAWMQHRSVTQALLFIPSRTVVRCCAPDTKVLLP